MARIKFTRHLERHLAAPPLEAAGGTVREVLDQAFGEHPNLRGYVLDDQGRLRKHVVIFVDGQAIQDRTQLGDTVGDESELLVMQALSGG